MRYRLMLVVLGVVGALVVPVGAAGGAGPATGAALQEPAVEAGEDESPIGVEDPEPPLKSTASEEEPSPVRIAREDRDELRVAVPAESIRMVLPTTKSLPQIIEGVVIHHSGNGGETDPRAVQDAHMRGRGFYDIGYHFMIGPDGTIYGGRDLGVRGQHLEAANTGEIGILIMGDFEPGLGRFPWIGDFGGSDTPTPEQLAAAEELIVYLDAAYGVDRVIGHRDGPFSDTVCPGHNLYPMVEQWDAPVSDGS